MTQTIADEPGPDLEKRLFVMLVHTYVQRADERQAAMGLQYTTAETHDLARVIARFVAREQGK